MEFEKKLLHSLSLKQHLKIIYASCCNSCGTTEEEDDNQKSLHHSYKHRSCCKWLKSELSKLFSGKQRRRNRRSNSSSEFKYDPMSYSLNFEDDDSHLDEFPLRDFCSRLPPSPVNEKVMNNNNVVVSTQISTWS